MGDGLVGWSIIKLAKENIGLSLAAENSGSTFFGNSSLPSGVLETPNKMTPEAIKNLRESWEGLHQGRKESPQDSHPRTRHEV
jgi:phage portal protein BeeE